MKKIFFSFFLFSIIPITTFAFNADIISKVPFETIVTDMSGLPLVPGTDYYLWQQPDGTYCQSYDENAYPPQALFNLGIGTFLGANEPNPGYATGPGGCDYTMQGTWNFYQGNTTQIWQTFNNTLPANNVVDIPLINSWTNFWYWAISKWDLYLVLIIIFLLIGKWINGRFQ